MNKNALRNIFIVLFAVSAVVACGTTPPRTQDQDRGIKSFAVISMLDNDAKVLRIGTTVFGNGSKEIGLKDDPNAVAIEAIEQRVSNARPNWAVRKVSSESASKLKHLHSTRGGSWQGFVGNIKDELKKTAADVDADALFVAVEYGTDETYGGAGRVGGVGMLYRCSSGRPINFENVYAHVWLILIDREGNELSMQSGGKDVSSKVNLGLSCELTDIDKPQILQSVSDAMIKQVRSSLSNAAANMGY